jgi:hypothetical protein
MNKNEENLRNEFKNEKWVKQSKNINIDKIISDLPSLTYFNNECKKLEEFCTETFFQKILTKPNLFESQNAKNLCRNGIPPNYIHDFILKLFNISQINEKNYEENFDLTFKNHNPKNCEDFVPYFSGFKTLNESLPVNYLNENGINNLKEILWMINNNYFGIEHSPIIIKILSLILLFCNKYEAYEIIMKLIDFDYNLNETYKIRWHLRFKFNDNFKIITSISESLKDITNIGNLYNDHFNNINFNIEKFYEDMIYGFYLEYLNFYGIIRLLPFFLLEGVKSLYRLTYAFEKVLKENILQINNSTNILEQIKHLGKKYENIQNLFEISYTLKLTRNNNKYDFQETPEEDLYKNKRNQYYLPKFDVQSNILDDYEIIHLWEKLPMHLKIKDAKLIYNTNKNGYNLLNIMELNDNYSNCNNYILFIILTKTNEKFGFFLEGLLNYTNRKFLSSPGAILFKLNPKIEIYDVLEEDGQVIYVDSTCLMFGNGKNGSAIRFDNNLNKGVSAANGCFKNPVLVENKNGEFIIQTVEIYMLN